MADAETPRTAAESLLRSHIGSYWCPKCGPSTSSGPSHLADVLAAAGLLATAGQRESPAPVSTGNSGLSLPAPSANGGPADSVARPADAWLAEHDREVAAQERLDVVVRLAEMAANYEHDDLPDEHPTACIYDVLTDAAAHLAAGEEP